MKDYFINIIKYEIWADSVIADFLAAMENPPQKAISLMSHIINANKLWLARILSKDENVKVWQEYEVSKLPDLAKESAERNLRYIENIDEDDLNNFVSYTNSKGEKFDSLLSDILIHMSHHSAYHRGQIVMLIKPLVSELPITDYIHFVRKIKKSK